MKIHNEPYAGRVLIWSAAFAFIVFLVWASWAELDQITRASGQVIASSRNQIIQSPEGGILSELMVHEGDSVQKGQILARFERAKVEASYEESASKAAALTATVARLKAEIFGGTPKFSKELDGYPEFRANQIALFNKRQSALREEISALEKSMKLIKEELEMNLPLIQTGDVSKMDILKVQRQLADIQGQITNKRNKYFQDAQTELVKAEEDLSGVLQLVAQRKEQLNFTEIYAPMNGVIRNVKLTTIGGVAKAGDEIMQIVPVGDDLIVEAKVKPSDIAFIKPGLPSTVKLDAYDYSIYGILNGEVIYISADTLNEETRNGDQPYYRVQIKTSVDNLVSKSNKKIDIQPGMTAIVEIKTGKKTVFDYLTKPITKTMSESMGER